MKNKKGFLSLCVLLFVSLFLGIVIVNKRESYQGLLSVKLLDTKKQSITINLEEYIKHELQKKNNDPISLNLEISQKLEDYLNNSEEEWFILNIKNNQKTKIKASELLKITKTIVLKPSPDIVIKRYTFTNGQEKNKFLSFELFTRCSKTIFSFPKNYSIEVVMIE